jgi:hypothetical protein
LSARKQISLLPNDTKGQFVTDSPDSELVPANVSANAELSDYRHDEAVIRASWIAIAIQVCLAIVIAVDFFLMFSDWFWPLVPLATGCLILEMAIGVFLYHCFFLFPKNSPGRFFPTLISPFIVLVQTVPLSNGLALGPLIAICVGFAIAGWLLHRFCGASLSMHGEAVFQEAVSTKVLLLLAPLLLLMGLAPTLAFMSFDGAQRTGAWFAETIVYSAVGLLGLTVVPLLSIYAFFWMVRMSHWGHATTAVVLIVLTAAFVVGEWAFGNSTYYCLGCAAFIATYFVGLLIAYAPFYAVGFRPVWAKRAQSTEAVQAISFDDIA